MAGLSADQLQELAGPVMDHLFFAYERVVMPCHNMNCGDVVHRRCVTDRLVCTTVHGVLHLASRDDSASHCGCGHVAMVPAVCSLVKLLGTHAKQPLT